MYPYLALWLWDVCMYVCACMCGHALVAFGEVNRCKCACVCMNACTCACVCLRLCVCVCVSVCLCVSVSLYVSVSVCVCLYVSVCVSVSVWGQSKWWVVRCLLYQQLQHICKNLILDNSLWFLIHSHINQVVCLCEGVAQGGAIYHSAPCSSATLGNHVDSGPLGGISLEIATLQVIQNDLVHLHHAESNTINRNSLNYNFNVALYCYIVIYWQLAMYLGWHCSITSAWAVVDISYMRRSVLSACSSAHILQHFSVKKKYFWSLLFLYNRDSTNWYH